MPYQVTIQPSGHTFTVQDHEAILDAALREGVVIAYGCRNGACGTCKGKIITGTVDYGVYQESALTAAEKDLGMALFCQARPRTDLVIECREVAAANDIQIRKLPCRVQKMERPAPDVMVLYLKLPANERLQFLAGQYIDMLLKDGVRRSFLAGKPAARRRVSAIAFAQLRRRVLGAGLHQNERARHPALRRSTRYLLSTRGQCQADHFARQRHRLCADQIHRRACA